LGLVSRKELGGLYPQNENFILEQNVVHLYVIENGKILSGHDFRDKSLSNYDFSILSGKMKISETISDNIRESCESKPKRVGNQFENEDEQNISSSHDHEGCFHSSPSPQNNLPGQSEEVA
jgi:hypothetical protein